MSTISIKLMGFSTSVLILAVQILRNPNSNGKKDMFDDLSVQKSRITVGENVFQKCNLSLVLPVHQSDGDYH